MHGCADLVRIPRQKSFDESRRLANATRIFSKPVSNIGGGCFKLVTFKNTLKTNRCQTDFFLGTRSDEHRSWLSGSLTTQPTPRPVTGLDHHCAWFGDFRSARNALAGRTRELTKTSPAMDHP